MQACYKQILANISSRSPPLAPVQDVAPTLVLTHRRKRMAATTTCGCRGRSLHSLCSSSFLLPSSTYLPGWFIYGPGMENEQTGDNTYTSPDNIATTFEMPVCSYPLVVLCAVCCVLVGGGGGGAVVMKMRVVGADEDEGGWCNAGGWSGRTETSQSLFVPGLCLLTAGRNYPPPYRLTEIGGTNPTAVVRLFRSGRQVAGRMQSWKLQGVFSINQPPILSPQSSIPPTNHNDTGDEFPAFPLRQTTALHIFSSAWQPFAATLPSPSPGGCRHKPAMRPKSSRERSETAIFPASGFRPAVIESLEFRGRQSSANDRPSARCSRSYTLFSPTAHHWLPRSHQLRKKTAIRFRGAQSRCPWGPNFAVTARQTPHVHMYNMERKGRETPDFLHFFLFFNYFSCFISSFNFQFQILLPY